ncbi:MAG: DUF4139 domain-containing protein [Phycisphaerae bacterium]|nr:DUF4139 domain-containing protein [Phycisphaerae bacterium]
MNTKTRWILILLSVITTAAVAKVDLVTLPRRDSVQLTIYNSADLTLVREIRNLTVKKEGNSLQFAWENTLIDPTSLQMLPKASADKIEILDLQFPPRVRNLGLWSIQSALDGLVPVEITYLTSGLSWRAFYMGTLSPDETKLHLTGYVRVMNTSGEDYENAQTRLIVGKVHLLDQIAELARRQYPYGSPLPLAVAEDLSAVVSGKPMDAPVLGQVMTDGRDFYGAANRLGKKEIVKEGLSEYFLYTIEGTETIENQWAKRLPSFEAAEIPVESLYKYDEKRWRAQTIGFLYFANDKDHKLGQTPLPDGTFRIFRDTGDKGRLSFVGRTSVKYVPVNEKIELNLGAARYVKVEPKLMDTKTDNYRFNNKGNIAGWDEIQTWKVTVNNTRDIPIKVEIYRQSPSTYWTLVNSGEFGDYEKEDATTLKYVLTLEPRSKKEFQYVLTDYQGTRREDFKREQK